MHQTRKLLHRPVRAGGKQMLKNYIVKEAWGRRKEDARVLSIDEAIAIWSLAVCNTVAEIIQENPNFNLEINLTTNYLKHEVYYRLIKKDGVVAAWKKFLIESTDGTIDNYDDCKDFFLKLVSEKSETHEVVASCNKDRSMYLIPKGTIDQLSYKGKPVDSYRLGDHWHWYANLKNAPQETIQCKVHGMPAPAPRKGEQQDKAGEALWFSAVAYTRDGNEYELLQLHSE